MEEKFDWTIMVYMAGDNNLSENMAFSLNELQTFRSLARNLDTERARIKVFAYFDSSSLTAPTHYIDYSAEPPLVHAIEEEDIFYRSKTTKIDEVDISDGDSASAYSIMNFVKWCIEKRDGKSSNYAMVFSGHSEAFKNTTFLQDESAGNNMSLFKFRWAMEQLQKEFFGKNLRILGFDSCVMSMLEVGYELKDVANVIVASEGSIPNSGWGYTTLLNEVISSFPQVMTPDYVKALAKKFVVAFTEHYKKLAIGGRSVDIAAWDLKEINPLAESVNELAKELNKYLDLTDKVQDESISEDDIAIFQELKKIILQSHFNAQTFMKEQSVDIKDFCKQIIFESGFLLGGKHNDIFASIIDKCETVIKNVDICVLKNGYVGEEYQFSNGISIYFPWTLLTYSMTNYNYRYLRFNKGHVARPDHENLQGIGKDWRNFLSNYLSRVTLRGTRKTLNDRVSLIEDLSKDNPVWSRDNPVWSRDNPVWSRDNPVWSRDNPVWSRDNPVWSKGEGGNSLFYFAKFKNFQLSWKISGYGDETEYP